MREDFETKVRLMREFNREECKRAEERLDLLENAINQEVNDRITETDELVGETQEVLTSKWLQNNGY
jgi:hypothetical protein